MTPPPPRASRAFGHRRRPAPRARARLRLPEVSCSYSPAAHGSHDLSALELTSSKNMHTPPPRPRPPPRVRRRRAAPPPPPGREGRPPLCPAILGSHIDYPSNENERGVMAAGGRHCHSTLSLPLTGCHCLGIYAAALLSFPVEMTVSASYGLARCLASAASSRGSAYLERERR
jgi:hypothetical protein